MVIPLPRQFRYELIDQDDVPFETNAHGSFEEHLSIVGLIFIRRHIGADVPRYEPVPYEDYTLSSLRNARLNQCQRKFPFCSNEPLGNKAFPRMSCLLLLWPQQTGSIFLRRYPWMRQITNRNLSTRTPARPSLYLPLFLRINVFQHQTAQDCHSLKMLERCLEGCQSTMARMGWR